jgi:hypothetical protein
MASAPLPHGLAAKMEGKKLVFTRCPEVLTELRIPDEFDGTPVEEFGVSFINNSAVKQRFFAAKKLVLSKNLKIYTDLREPFANITELDIPDGCRKIEEGAFYGYKMLKQLHLPKNLKIIPEGMCQGCAALETVDFPDGVKRIKKAAFKSCKSLRITEPMPTALEQVDVEAFRFCASLQTLSFGENLALIQKGAFTNCKELTEVRFAKAIEIGERVFPSETKLLVAGSAIAQKPIELRLQTSRALYFLEDHFALAVLQDGDSPVVHPPETCDGSDQPRG